MPADVRQLLKLSRDYAAAGAKVDALARVVVAKTAADLTSKAQQLVVVRTGNLRASIGADVNGLSAEVGPTASYGPYIEYGTYKMAPRPYMAPALDAVAPKFEAAMGLIASKALG